MSRPTTALWARRGVEPSEPHADLEPLVYLTAAPLTCFYTIAPAAMRCRRLPPSCRPLAPCAPVPPPYQTHIPHDSQVPSHLAASFVRTEDSGWSGIVMIVGDSPLRLVPPPVTLFASLLPHLSTCLSNKAASPGNTLGDCSTKSSCTGLAAADDDRVGGSTGDFAGVLPPPGRAFRSALRVEAWSTRKPPSGRLL